MILTPLAAAAATLPSHESLAQGPWNVTLLPGQPGFVFTMYGCPGELEKLKEMVGVMREKGLGNGFDPGPTACAASKPLFEYLASIHWPMICYPGFGDFQIKDGNARLSDADETAMQVLDQAGDFSAIQLGEWGYYFHNLSLDENWWRGVYGADFDKMKPLMKPKGLAGYDIRPKDKRECYEIVKDYFTTRQRAMRGRNMSVTGHSHYEAYAAEWGARVVGLEVCENIAFTQSKIAFARGAARQWGLPWSLQASPWFSGACTTNGPLRIEGKDARGLDAGHSLSLYRRMWLHGWFAGAAMVTPENSSAIFFEDSAKPDKLTSHGEAAAEFFAFTRSHDRGIPYTPVAVVLDHLAGYNGFMGHPWGILENTPGDTEINDLFVWQLYPNSDHIHQRPNPDNPEDRYLRATPYGEMADVLLSTAKTETLSAYPVLLLAGDIDFDPAFVDALCGALKGGSRVLLYPRHRDALGDAMKRLQAAGAVEVLDVWTNPATQRPAAIADKRLARLAAEHLPLAVSGDPVQYQINRIRDGWVVELVNNAGVAKKPKEPAVVDPSAAATVKITPGIPAAGAKEWCTGQKWPANTAVTVQVPPGETRFVEVGNAG
jgi:hypothetical protein